MLKILDYQIVSSSIDDGKEAFYARIREEISYGWQPIGGVTIRTTDTIGRVVQFYQAMVMYEKPKS